MKKILFKTFVVGSAICTAVIGFSNNNNFMASMPGAVQTNKNGKLAGPELTSTQNPRLNIANSFIPCGWMGDGKKGKLHLSLIPNSSENPHSTPSCIKISYKTGPEGWAGIYWLNQDCNWGDFKGYDLSSRRYNKITFWAKGERGGESVQFKAGGVKDKKFKDSFDYEPKLDVSLEKQWKKYTLDLKGKDLSNVIGGFCWIANSDVTLYLDDLQYE